MGLPDNPSAGKRITKKQVTGIVIGNWLEFFDFVVYSIFAVTIGKAFFPATDPNTQILLSLATFGVGFLARPLGSIIIGAYADRAGRKAAMTMTIMFMAVGTAIIAFTPPYAAIGLAAPVLLVIARLLQGFSAGGELGAATSLLIEMAPTGRRGLFGSWQIASQGLAIVTGALIGVALNLLLAPEAMQSWGWRVPFVLGLLIAPIGLYIRNNLEETAEVTGDATSMDVLKTLFKDHGLLLLCCIIGVGGGTISNYVLNTYMVTFAIQTLHMPPTLAMLAGLTGGAVLFLGSLLGGYLSDVLGRRQLTLWPRIVMILLTYPLMMYLTQAQTLGSLLGAIAVLSGLLAISAAPGLILMPESFPRSVRAAALSISYAIATTLFGSTAPALASWMIVKTGTPMSLAWFLIIANGIALLAIIPMRAPKANEALD
jgi:MFS family permease